MSETALEDFLTKEQKVLEDIDPEIISKSCNKFILTDIDEKDFLDSADITDCSEKSSSIKQKPNDMTEVFKDHKESQALLDWRKDFEQKIKNKDEKEIRDREELEKKAKLELDNWKKTNSLMVSDNKELNDSKRKEAAQINGNYSAEDPAIWKKIWSLCTSPNAKTKNIKDTTRMKSILESMGTTNGKPVKVMD